MIIKYKFLLVIIISLAYSQEYQTDIAINFHGVSGYMVANGQEETRLATNITVGQNFVGTMEKSGCGNEDLCSMDIGFWSFYLLPPKAPIVSASDGDPGLGSAVGIEYTVDILSPPITHSPPYEDVNNDGQYSLLDGDIITYTGNIPEGHWQIRRDDNNPTYESGVNSLYTDGFAEAGVYHTYGVVYYRCVMHR